MTKNDSELRYREAHDQKIRELAKEECEFAKANRKAFGDRTHVAGVMLEEMFEAWVHTSSIHEGFAKWFETCVMGGSGTDEREMLEAIRDHAADGAAETLQIAAVCQKAIETMEEWSEE